MCKVFIWGTGFWGEKCFHNLLPEVDIIGFVESKVSKNNFRGKKVISGSELVGYDYDYVIQNNGTITDLKQKAKELIDEVIS